MADYKQEVLAFHAANDAWQRELKAAFGRAAGAARYDGRGKSLPSYVAREQARLALWRAISNHSIRHLHPR